jgi:hypothetical protein
MPTWSPCDAKSDRDPPDELGPFKELPERTILAREDDRRSIGMRRSSLQVVDDGNHPLIRHEAPSSERCRSSRTILYWINSSVLPSLSVSGSAVRAERIGCA